MLSADILAEGVRGLVPNPFGIAFGEGKLFSDPFPTGVAGKERDAWTAESIFSQSRVGELGADFRVTSCCLSRTASSCRKSEVGRRKIQKPHIILATDFSNMLIAF